MEERSVAANKVELGRWRRRDVAIDAVEVVEAGGGKFHHFASHSLSPVTWPSMGAMLSRIQVKGQVNTWSLILKS